MNPKDKLLSPTEAIEKSKMMHEHGESLVLAGGCFDILHRGHILLLQKAKEKGGVLFVLIESDETIRKIKGSDRPINNQNDRAYVLSRLVDVDYLILLPGMMTDDEYDELIFALKPAIIATTKGDPAKKHKIRQAKKVNARLLEVIKPIKNVSTTSLEKIVNN